MLNWLRRLQAGIGIPQANYAKKPRRIRLGLQPLEARWTPTVSALLNSPLPGDLTLTGDAAADLVVLESYNASTDTLAYSSNGDSLTAVGVTGTVYVNLGAGDDTVVLDDPWSFNCPVAFDGGGNVNFLAGNNNGNAVVMTGPDAGSINDGGTALTFANVDDVVAGSGLDSITGANSSATWALGTSSQYAGGTTFSGFETVVGGSDVDTFNMAADVSADITSIFGGGGADILEYQLAGPQSSGLTFDGQGGSNRIDFSLVATARTVTVTSVASGAGSEATTNLVFANVGRIDGGTSTSDALIGMPTSAGSFFIQTGLDQYVVGSDTLSVEGFNDFFGSDAGDTFVVSVAHVGLLQGEEGNDQFQLSAALTGELSGGLGDDSFQINTGGSCSGFVDGDGGLDRLDYAGRATAVAVVVTGSTVDGMALTATATGGATGINELTGSTATDELTNDANADSTFDVDGSNTFNYSGSLGGALAFAAIENLTGDDSATKVDTFLMAANHTGNLNGQSGTDIFTFTAGELTGNASGGLDGDVFNFNGGNITGAVQGGAGNDTFAVVAATTVTGGIGGEAGDDSFTFTADTLIANVNGGDNDDDFRFNSGDVTGNINGDGGADEFTTLADGSNIIGSINGGEGNDSVAVGHDWAVSFGIQGDAGDDSFAFGAGTVVADINGGPDNDDFRFNGGHVDGDVLGDAGGDEFTTNANGSTVTGQINGGGGSDSIAIGHNLIVNLGITGDLGDDSFDFGAGMVTAEISGGDDNDDFRFSGGSITGSVTGGSGADEFTTNAGGGVVSGSIAGGIGNDSVAIGHNLEVKGGVLGGDDDDAFAFLGGVLKADVAGGPDVDQFFLAGGEVDGQVTGDTEADEFVLTANTKITGGIHGGDGHDLFDFQVGVLTANASGNLGDDTFTFDGSASIDGFVAGNTETNDTLDFSSSDFMVAVVLAGASADGYNGTAGKVITSGGFTGIDRIIGGSGDSFRGRHSNSNWNIGVDFVEYVGGSTTLTLSGIATLTGGAAADTWNILDNSNFVGTIAGGVGLDKISASGYTTGNLAITLSDNGSGSITSSDGSNPLTISAFTSVESLTAGHGNDTIIFGTTGRLTGSLDGGPGADWLDYSAHSSAILVNFPANSAALIGNLIGAAGNSSVENVSGGSGDDLIFGDDDTNTLHGQGGADIIVGGANADTINGHAGRDVLIGGTGADTISGGADDDILIGGTTDYDDNVSALNAIRAEWTSDRPALVRRAFLSGARGGKGRKFILNTSTVFNDGSADVMDGGANDDWHWSFLGDSNSNNELLN